MEEKKTKEPILLIMAAGMGSRFGGLKQIEPVSNQNEIILDFSLYDAMMAGFKKVVFVIKEEMEEAFRSLIDRRAGKHMEIEYAFQKTDDIPEGFTVPEGREKPWGTGHAVMAARNYIDAPFVVINADDYYGHEAFQLVYDYLSNLKYDMKYDCCMVGFTLAKTVTENGYVSRGVCGVDEHGYLVKITERTMIMERGDDICCSEDEGKTWQTLNRDDVVSMNFWGFPADFINEIISGFPAFLETALKENPLKCEYFLPDIPDRLIRDGRAECKVLRSDDKWYGVTYKEDKPDVIAALQSMKDKGIYPEILWK